MDLLAFWLGFAGGFGCCLAAAFQIHEKLMKKQEARLEACKDMVAKYGHHTARCKSLRFDDLNCCDCGWSDILFSNENKILDKMIDNLENKEREGA